MPMNTAESRQGVPDVPLGRSRSAEATRMTRIASAGKPPLAGMIVVERQTPRRMINLKEKIRTRRRSFSSNITAPMLRGQVILPCIHYQSRQQSEVVRLGGVREPGSTYTAPELVFRLGRPSGKAPPLNVVAGATIHSSAIAISARRRRLGKAIVSFMEIPSSERIMETAIEARLNPV